ncbi:MAG: hypothetical protein WDN69_05015 [Aliidongia sp.]
MQLDFAFDGVAPAPVPDVIAIAATPAADGILTVPFSQGRAAAFVVATDNLGVAGTNAADTDFNGAALPLTICQTDTTTGACRLSPPAAAVTLRASARLHAAALRSIAGM